MAKMLPSIFCLSSSPKIKKLSLWKIEGKRRGANQGSLFLSTMEGNLDLLLNNLETFLILFEANLICMILSAYADENRTPTPTHTHTHA